MKKSDVLKDIDTAAAKFTKITTEFKVPDYIKRLDADSVPDADSVDAAIDMHLKIVDILSAMRKLYNNDCIECNELINVLKKAVADPC